MPDDFSMDNLQDEDYDVLEQLEGNEDYENDNPGSTDKDVTVEDKGSDDKTNNKPDNTSEEKSSETKNEEEKNKSNLQLFAQSLKEESVISDIPEDHKFESFDDIAALIKNEIQKNEYSDLNEHQKEFLNKLKSGFDVNDFIESKTKENDVNSVDENKLKEDETLQKQLIKEDFVSKGYSQEKAEKLTQRSFDLGTNEEDAFEAFEDKKARLKEEEKQKESQKQKELEENQQRIEKLKSQIKDTVFDEKNDILPGVKYNKSVADKVYDSMVNPVEYKDNRGISVIEKARSENPIEFEKNLHALYHLTEGFKDFSVFKEPTSKKSKEFLESLNSNSTVTNGSTSYDSDELDLDYIEQNLV